MICAGKRVGSWVLKQGSLNTALIEATARLLMMELDGTENYKLRIVRDCGFAVMAVKSTTNAYKLFAFKIDEADKLLPKEYQEEYYKALIDDNFKETA